MSRKLGLRQLSVALVLGVGGLLPACGDSEVEPGVQSDPAWFEHLEPKPLQPASNETLARRYRRLSPTPDAPWSIEGARARIVPLDESEQPASHYTLLLNQIEQPSVRIPGPLEPSAFNSVTLLADFGPATRITLEFLRQGEAVIVNHWTRSGTGPGPQVIQIHAPELGNSTGEIDELCLRIASRARFARIDWIDLNWVPCASFFPDPVTGAALIELGGEQRRGIGVSSRRPVAARFEAPARGSLCFTYGVPPCWTGTGEAPTLELILTGAAGEVLRQSFPLEPGAEEEWRTARVPLGGCRGESVEARWQVVSEGEAGVALAEVGVLTEGAAPRRVVLITSDTHRADHLGAAERGIAVRTPALDALAERGILFEDCLSSTNITNPSHVALMTATHPRDTGILQNNQRMNDAPLTLAEAFRKAGFVTYASISAQHLGDTISGLGQGFDRMSGPQLSRTREGAETIDVIEAWVSEAGGRPLFLWLHVFDAHTPYEPPTDVAREYYPDLERAFDPSRPPPSGIPASAYEDHFPGLRDLEYPLAMYRGEITYLDAELQRLFALPGLQRAIIGFTADHGESLGNHGIYYAHSGLYADTLQVPLILSFPDGPRGVRCSSPVRQIDLGRTLLDLSGRAGVEFPGTNLLSALEEEPGPRAPRFAISYHGRSASVTADGWHLIFNLSAGGGPRRLVKRVHHAVELYYLPDDVGCAHDLLDREPSRARELRGLLVDWLTGAEDRGWRGEVITDAATLRDLEALGYAGSAQASPTAAELYDPSCRCEWCARFE